MTRNVEQFKKFYSGKIFRLETIEGKIIEVDIQMDFIIEVQDKFIIKLGETYKIIERRLVRKLWRYKKYE